LKIAKVFTSKLALEIATAMILFLSVHIFLIEIYFMHLFWDCRSVAPQMGGIGRATVGWLNAFLEHMPDHWQLTALFSSICTDAFVIAMAPAMKRHHIIRANAGMIDRPFDEFILPSLLEKYEVNLYFNTTFSVPSLPINCFYSSVVHDVVFFDHPDMVEDRLRDYLAHATEIALRRADLVFTVSEFSKTRILHWKSIHGWEEKGNLHVIYPIIQLPQKRFQNRGIEENYLFYLGSIERKKGVVLLLQAYQQARQKAQIPMLVIAGGVGGQSLDVQQEISRLGLAHKVRVLGTVTDEQKWQLLTEASIFIFPSKYEGFGIPPLEAMACRIPVLAANGSAMPEVLGDAAEYFDSDDVCSLANALIRLADRSGVDESRIERGLLRAQSFANGMEQSARMISLFQDLSRNR
jgi:glycosyltransferase involved in cell wall biosynthesis